MNIESLYKPRPGRASAAPDSPILLVPYMWIGDFVRCHTVVKLLKQRFPSRPIDVLTAAMVSPLLDYMPGVRKGIVVDLPRRRLARAPRGPPGVRREGYGDALVCPAPGNRRWRSISPESAAYRICRQAVSASSTTCAGASAGCRGWSSGVPRSLCPGRNLADAVAAAGGGIRSGGGGAARPGA